MRDRPVLALDPSVWDVRFDNEGKLDDLALCPVLFHQFQRKLAVLVGHPLDPDPVFCAEVGIVNDPAEHQPVHLVIDGVEGLDLGVVLRAGDNGEKGPLRAHDAVKVGDLLLEQETRVGGERSGDGVPWRRGAATSRRRRSRRYRPDRQAAARTAPEALRAPPLPGTTACSEDRCRRSSAPAGPLTARLMDVSIPVMPCFGSMGKLGT